MMRPKGWHGESTRHSLAAKGVKTGAIKTHRGVTDYKSVHSDIVIMNRYMTQLASGEHQEALDRIRDYIRKNFKLNPYGESYMEQLETSYNLYGSKGVKAQIAYIISNATAKTPEGKKFRKDVAQGKLVMFAKGDKSVMMMLPRKTLSALENGEIRQAFGLESDSKSRYMHFINNDYSDTEAQLKVYQERGVIVNGIVQWHKERELSLIR